MPELAGVAANPLDQRADGNAARAFGLPGFLLVDPGGAGDIEVYPGRVADELLEEHGGGDGAAVAGAAGVHDVGDLALDLVAVIVGAGHAPELFAGGGETVEEA